MTIHKASEAPYQSYDILPTGFKIDEASGIGGIPSRRITEIYGKKSVGKSTLCLQLVAAAQADDMPCLWLDQEYTFDFGGYAQGMGVDMKTLSFVREEAAEDALDDALRFANDQEGGLIVIDSIGALQPRIQAEKTTGQKTIGTQAKLVSGFCRNIVPILLRQNHTLVVINHSFQHVMSGAEMTSGGEKLDYYKSLSIRLKLAYGKSVTRESDGAKVGVVIEAEIMKNKMAGTVGTKADLMMVPGQGFSREHDKLQAMLKSGEVVKKGNTFWMEKEKMGVGMKAARNYLKTITSQKIDK